MSVIYSIGAAAAVALGVFAPSWAILNGFAKWRRRSRRPAVVPPSGERVLILGASGGIGRALAYRYAARGAKICVVARRSGELDAVRTECEALLSAHAPAPSEPSAMLSICGDITRAQDLIAIREEINESVFHFACQFTLQDEPWPRHLTPPLFYRVARC